MGLVCLLLKSNTLFVSALCIEAVRNIDMDNKKVIGSGKKLKIFSYIG